MPTFGLTVSGLDTSGLATCLSSSAFLSQLPELIDSELLLSFEEKETRTIFLSGSFYLIQIGSYTINSGSTSENNIF